MTGASNEEFKEVFEIYKDTVLAIASRKFGNGELRPCITNKDIACS